MLKFWIRKKIKYQKITFIGDKKEYFIDNTSKSNYRVYFFNN